MREVGLGTQAQAPVVRGIVATLAAVFGSSSRERRRREREEAWRREEEIVREANKRRPEASGMTESKWLDLVRGKDGAR